MKNSKRMIGIVGTGMIAGSMAVLAAGHGFRVSVLARSQASVDRCAKAVADCFQQLRRRGVLNDAQAEACSSLISYSQSYEDLALSEIIFEAVAENVDVKYEVYRQIEAHCPVVRAICSVSSSIIPEVLAQGAGSYSDRIVVTHPFNPPHMVPYFELCGSDQTGAGVMDYVKSLLEELDRKPVVLKKPTPGFIGNRLQFALWRESLALVEEGICDPRDVDTCLQYSFCPRYTAIGIFEHFDNGGLELNAATCRNIWPILSNRTQIPDFMKQLMDEGKMGARSETKTGFYDWNGIDMQAYSDRVMEPYWQLLDWDIPEK